MIPHGFYLCIKFLIAISVYVIIWRLVQPEPHALPFLRI
jgi:hypothetical protein